MSIHSAIYSQLEEALVAAGAPRQATKVAKGSALDLDGPICAIVNLGLDASQYAAILIEFAPKLTVPNEIEMVARCMRQRKAFTPAVPWLLSLFEGFPDNQLKEANLWAIGDAISAIDAKAFYRNIAAICGETRYGSGRQMLFRTLGRIRTEEAFRVLIACLDDQTVRASAIEALGRSGRVDAIPILEQLEVKKGLYEFKAKTTALRRLYKFHDNSTSKC